MADKAHGLEEVQGPVLSHTWHSPCDSSQDRTKEGDPPK